MLLNGGEINEKEAENMNKKKYAPHLKCTNEDIGKYVIFHHDIYWVEEITKLLSEVDLISQYGVYFVFTGYLKSKKVTVVSTGMGAPTTAMALDELATLGAKKFFKIGTCGALQDNLQHGDIIIPTGAVRNEGTTKTYIIDDFPAIPTYKSVKKIENSLDSMKIRAKFGVIWSTDGYHSVMSCPDFFEYWRNAGVYGVEMESSAFFTVGYLKRVDVAAVLVVNRSYEQIQDIMKGKGNWSEKENKVNTALKKVIAAVINVFKEDQDG